MQQAEVPQGFSVHPFLSHELIGNPCLKGLEFPWEKGPAKILFGEPSSHKVPVMPLRAARLLMDAQPSSGLSSRNGRSSPG